MALSRKLRAESKESPLRGGHGGPPPPFDSPLVRSQKAHVIGDLVILDICIFFAALQLSTCSSPSTLYTRHHMPHSFSMSVASLRDYSSTHKVPQPSIHRLKHFAPSRACILSANSAPRSCISSCNTDRDFILLVILLLV